jgi:hypothetical protein
MANSIGNEHLNNEKVHTFEAGWRGWFMDNKIQLAANLFYNLYRDRIDYVVDLPVRNGIPVVGEMIHGYDNEGLDADALGGELEIRWQPIKSCMFWGNVSARTDFETREDLDMEPELRFNLGGQYDGGDGLVASLALHYVSSYHTFNPDPESMVTPELQYATMGEAFLLLGRVGYRLVAKSDQSFEAGLTVRAPLGGSMYEHAGSVLVPYVATGSEADFAGEVLMRLISGYIRGSF